MGEKLELTTVDVNGVQSSVNLDTKDIMDSITGKPFKIIQQQTNKPSGTTVSITLKPTYSIPSLDLRDEATFIPAHSIGYVALNQPILPIDQNGNFFPISINFTGDYSSKIDTGQDYLDSRKFKKGFTVESDAWDADVYLGEISKYPDHHILSSGIFQFKKKIETQLGSVKNNLIINFRPKVDATDSRYPINDTRENFKEHAEKNVTALNQIFQRFQSAQQVEDLGRFFSNLSTLPTVNIFEPARGTLSALPSTAVTKSEVNIPPVVRVKDRKLLDTNNNPISFLDSDKISSAITGVPLSTPLFHNNVTLPEQDFEAVVPLMAEIASVFRTVRDTVANFSAFKNYPVADNYVGVSLDIG